MSDHDAKLLVFAYLGVVLLWLVLLLGFVGFVVRRKRP